MKSSAPRSPAGVFLRRLRGNPAAMTGAVLLGVLYVLALFGSFVAPYDPRRSRTDAPHHPPTRLRFVDADGRFHGRPFIYRTELVDVLRRKYDEDASVRYPLRLWARGDRYRLWWLFETDRHLFGLGPPEGPDSAGAALLGQPRLLLFGADGLGRCVFSRILAGGKISLSIGLIGVAITMTLGLIVGGISGYAGGRIDAALMRLVELVMSVPVLYLILALRAALSETNPLLGRLFGLAEGEGLESGQIYVLMVAILGLVYWAGTARVVRGMVLATKELDYVAAARALGASPLRIILFHLLPNTLTYVIIAATLSIPYYILGEVTLSFLGVGIEEPQASWGNMLTEAQALRALVDFPWLLTPGVFIFLAVFAFNFLGDGVRDALDPKYLD